MAPGRLRFVPLDEALDESRFGGKAAQCARATRAGLPVPIGYAFPCDAVTSPRDAFDRASLDALLADLQNLVAVRSSAIGEDSAVASFAGQHATVLGVRTVDALLSAFDEVVRSGRTESAIAYRRKLGLDETPKMGVVVQRLVRSDVAGVLFTRDPRTGEDVRVIEASFGLGEAVVSGLVTPDRFRVARGGRVLARELGDKDLAIRWSESGGTEEVLVDSARAATYCMHEGELAALDELATRCEEVFGGTQDLEFAFERGELHLLQRRAITRG